MRGSGRKFRPEGHCLASRGFAEWCQTVIPRDVIFYPHRTLMFDSFSLTLLNRNTGDVNWATTQKTVLAKTNEATPQAHSRSMIGTIVSFYIQCRYFYLSEQHGLWIDCILTEELTMGKMIPTDFVLMLPNILGHRCTCYKSHDQSRLMPPRVRQEFLIPVKMAETLSGMQEKNFYPKRKSQISLSGMQEFGFPSKLLKFRLHHNLLLRGYFVFIFRAIWVIVFPFVLPFENLSPQVCISKGIKWLQLSGKMCNCQKCF